MDMNGSDRRGPGSGLGFTLVELLTVLGIAAVLMAIVMPCLTRTREAARRLVCQTHLANLGKALEVYAARDRFYPPAYLYGTVTSTTGGTAAGVIHWSGLLMRDGQPEEAFHCPTVPRGGLPPADTQEANLEPGQVCRVPGAVDRQAERCAYTANEALFPRDRFVLGFEGAVRVSRYVDAARVRLPAGTVVLSEWTSDWTLLAADGVCRSYLPVHGFCGIGPMGEDRYDLNQVQSEDARPCQTLGLFRRLSPDLLSDAPSAARSNPPRLDWLGRHHGGRTNFLYADAHVEIKPVRRTLDEAFEWGRAVYSIEGGERVVP